MNTVMDAHDRYFNNGPIIYTKHITTSHEYSFSCQYIISVIISKHRIKVKFITDNSVIWFKET